MKRGFRARGKRESRAARRGALDHLSRSLRPASVSAYLSLSLSLRLARALRRPRSIAITFGVADSSGGGGSVGAVVVVGARDERERRGRRMIHAQEGRNDKIV